MKTNGKKEILQIKPQTLAAELALEKKTLTKKQNIIPEVI